MFTIPNNIHFIWIGSPEKLKNHLTPNCLFQWKKYAEQYSFTLWLDSRYTEKKHDE